MNAASAAAEVERGGRRRQSPSPLLHCCSSFHPSLAHLRQLQPKLQAAASSSRLCPSGFLRHCDALMKSSCPVRLHQQSHEGRMKSLLLTHWHIYRLPLFAERGRYHLAIPGLCLFSSQPPSHLCTSGTLIRKRKPFITAAEPI